MRSGRACWRIRVTPCLPACEDLDTLRWLSRQARTWDVPLLFDLDAYLVSESESASRRLFADLDVARPAAWPEWGSPAVVKPDSASGSEGVCVVADETELSLARASLEAAGHAVVVEEYVAGPSLSLEVLAWEGCAVSLQVTGLEFDAACDCKRVVAPVGEAGAGAPAPGSSDWGPRSRPVRSLPSMSPLSSSGGLGLRRADGRRDDGSRRRAQSARDGRAAAEPDARPPCYWSSGINIVDKLIETARPWRPPKVDRDPRRACVYQHVRARRGLLEVLGEHVMGSARPLALVPGFFGVVEALTDYRPHAREWSATLISTGATMAEAKAAAEAAVEEMADREKLERAPEGEGLPVTQRISG